jgi:iron complex outermembrane recepter protein
MRFKKSRICSAVLAAAGGAVALSLPVHAQETQTITVTGSRILQLVTSSSPVAEVQAEEIQFSGTTRVEDLINTLPQLSPSFDSFTVNPTTGFATADLRGLGSNRTLVLVNGQRLQPGGIRSEARDLNQIPAALIKRIDILTGGASAVYGSDAMAGVVNFILDTEFEGFSGQVGWSGYQHKNRDTYLRPLMDARGFTYPTGSSGPDGEATNVDLAFGSAFADGKGHAMAYFTWRKNDELRQGARDYSSCALSAAGTACGGSGTSVEPNFLIQATRLDGTRTGFAGFRLNPDGTWAAGSPPPYNYAPINHYQRPDERWTFGSSLKYEVNEHFRPFVETMFSNTNTRVQIAESGTFFVNDANFECSDPLLGSLCSDLGLDPTVPLLIYIGKRNSEGGPRISAIESNSFRVVTGVEGELGLGTWFYNASFLYGRNSSNEANINDFITSRLDDAIRSGAYDVFTPGGVTAAQAAALSGTGMRQGATQLMSVNAYLTGDIGVTIPGARDPIAVVVGAEWREEKYDVDTDANMSTGNFTGLGGPRLPISGRIAVQELFTEVNVPLVRDMGFLKSLDADLGYRYSDYSTSGGVNTYKVGGTANVADIVRVRGGFNRAIRAANTGELFAGTQIALFSGDDPCAGATPSFTLAQCQNTGVTPAQYGSIPASPANQYNQFIGGNAGLDPETADTFTIGLVVTPLQGLTVGLDYFDIKITERIGVIGANNILNFCGTTGDPALCNLIRRNPASGDLWVGSSVDTSGYITNLNANFGEFRRRGVDLTAFYTMNVLGGRLATSFTGTYNLEDTVAPLAGFNDDATYDCAGKINTSCQTPQWRHSMSLRYSRDSWTANIRWRYIGELDYVLTNGNPGTQDQILVNNGGKVSAWNYLDLSGSFDVTKNVTLTAGVNNVLDKAPPMVGGTLILNANSIGGYDQLGRFLFANVRVRF